MFVLASKYEALQRESLALSTQVTELKEKVSAFEAQVADMLDPMAQVQRDIALAEKQIELAEQHAKLRKLQEDPDEEPLKRPTRGDVLSIGRAEYERQKSAKKGAKK